MVSTKLHTVLIEKLVPGGLGLGRLPDGMVVLVRYVLPGEKVVIREVNRKRDYVTATLEEISTPSPDRIEPPCPLYGRCGGCDLQHASYNTQVLLKKELLAESIQRTADIFTDTEFSVASALASPEELAYRQRIRLHVDEQGHYGFFRSESHTLETVSECLLAKGVLNSVLGQLQANRSFQELVKLCTAIELLLNPDNNKAIMLLHFRRKPRPRDSSLAAEATRDIREISFILMQVKTHGLYDPQNRSFVSLPPRLSQTVSTEILQSDITLTWEAGGFCQVNLGQNNNLINLVLGMIKQNNHDRVLDLYCGYGNFSLPTAQFAGEVLGIDSQNGAIRSARFNATLNKARNCHFINKKVVQGISSLIRAGEFFDVVILDPPRQGAADTISMLSELGAEQIIYISCNPATLGRDLALFSQQGYTLFQLIPVDMFPQTHHVESVALLKRSTL